MSRALDTVLAALRYWQATNASNEEIAPEPLSHDEIDELCEALNCDGITVEVRGGCVVDVGDLGLPVRVIDHDIQEEEEPAAQYSVVVGNIGTVYDGADRGEAQTKFMSYVDASMAPTGRAAGETVTLFCDDDVIGEHIGSIVPECD